MASLMDESYSYGMDKLTYEIFSILENKFLSSPIDHNRGKVRILSIDDSDDCLLAAVSLSRLESSLRSRSNNPNASVTDFFDVAAGCGLGGVLVAMLFTRGPGGKSLFSAEEALHFLTNNRNQRSSSSSSSSVLKRLIFHRSDKGILSSKMFGGGSTLRDMLKPVLIPCYDLTTGAPFLFSRADAMETDAYDFNISRICAATCADRRRPVEVRSADGHTRIVAQGGGVAMSNPTAAAITHVLNNKQEFPFAAGVGDLLVLSLGSASTTTASGKEDTLKIAVSAAADVVDQAVATEFGDTGNYVRVRDNLAYKNVQSSLFRGKRISLLTNADKLEELCGKLVKEEKRRISCPIPTVCIKLTMSPRSSSATTCTTSTNITASTDDSCCKLDIYC